MVFKKEAIIQKEPREGEFVDRESLVLYIYMVRLRYINKMLYILRIFWFTQHKLH